jgi:hypothetical protein
MPRNRIETGLKPCALTRDILLRSPGFTYCATRLNANFEGLTCLSPGPVVNHG